MKWCIQQSPNNEFSKLNNGRIKLWVRSGPGIGAKALRRGWVPLKGGNTQPVLDDSRIRSSLLSPEMGIQLLGVLNHRENEKDCANSKLLSQIDQEIIQYYHVWRLSDKRFTVRTRARGPPNIIGGASTKIQLVYALLNFLTEMDRGIAVNFNKPMQDDQAINGNNKFLSIDYDPPLIVRHESISREFKGPAMDEASLTTVYAIFGRAPKLSKGRCILVTGEPADYCTDLEELVVQDLGGIPMMINGGVSVVNQSKAWRAAIRLLSHLENEESFHKFLKRDFDDFEVVTQSWKKLKKRRECLENLQKAKETKDAKNLENILIQAEEACEDDPDGGDAILESARSMLCRLKEEELAMRLKNRSRILEDLKRAETAGDINKLRISLSEAEKVCFEDDTVLLDNAKACLKKLEQELLDEHDSNSNLKSYQNKANVASADASIDREGITADNNTQQLSDIDICTTGLGRDRGRTLPAWMTSTDDPHLTKSHTLEHKQEESIKGEVEIKLLKQTRTDASFDKIEKQQSIDSALCDVGRGRGRGRTLPAWMTDNPISKTEQISGSEHEKMNQDGIDPDILEKEDINSPQDLNCMGRGRGRGRTLPAWMISSTEQSQLQSEKSTSEMLIDVESQNKAKSDVNIIPGLGRGRGRTLPAWLNSTDDPHSATHQTLNHEISPSKQAQTADLTNKNEKQHLIDNNPCEAGRGRGRKRTLPAWMTEDPSLKIENISGAEDEKVTQDGINQNIPKREQQVIGQELQGLNSMGRGRGKTLPAWMTSSTVTSQLQSEKSTCRGLLSDLEAQTEAKNILDDILHSEGGAGSKQMLDVIGIGQGVSGTIPARITSQDVGGLKRSRLNETSESSKKARTNCSYKYSLKVQLNSDQESNFFEWLQTTLRAATEAQGGSATLNRV